jgi:hypothetical protein
LIAYIISANWFGTVVLLGKSIADGHMATRVTAEEGCGGSDPTFGMPPGGLHPLRIGSNPEILLAAPRLVHFRTRQAQRAVADFHAREDRRLSSR